MLLGGGVAESREPSGGRERIFSTHVDLFGMPEKDIIRIDCRGMLFLISWRKSKMTWKLHLEGVTHLFGPYTNLHSACQTTLVIKINWLHLCALICILSVDNLQNWPLPLVLFFYLFFLTCSLYKFAPISLICPIMCWLSDKRKRLLQVENVIIHVAMCSITDGQC